MQEKVAAKRPTRQCYMAHATQIASHACAKALVHIRNDFVSGESTDDWLRGRDYAQGEVTHSPRMHEKVRGLSARRVNRMKTVEPE